MANKHINRIINYINHEQIAFQFADSLMVITQADTNRYDNEEDELLVEEMKSFIQNCKECRKVSSKDLISDNDRMGFNEFAKWSIDSDELYLVDDVLALCLPSQAQ